MADQIFWPIFGVVLLLAIAAMGILARHLKEQRRLALREMVQKERLAAMDKGIPITEWSEDMMTTASETSSNGKPLNLVALKLTSLGVGLVMIFAGIGMMFAFQLSGDHELVELTSLGVIPLMTGLGLVLFHWLIKRQHPSHSDGS